jgi:hypothetical protein
MSYDLALREPDGSIAIVPDGHDLRGGTYALGGSAYAELNITYNYGPHFRRVFADDKGVRSLYGMTGADSIPILRSAIAQLGNDVDPNDYWNPTEGNAKAALTNLLFLARACPTAIWEGD